LIFLDGIKYRNIDNALLIDAFYNGRALFEEEKS